MHLYYAFFGTYVSLDESIKNRTASLKGSPVRQSIILPLQGIVQVRLLPLRHGLR